MSDVSNIASTYNVGGIMGSLATGLYIIIIVAAISLLAWFVWKRSRYKNVFVIKDQTREGTITVFDRLRVKRNKKTQIVEWHLLKAKCKVPIAPVQAITRMKNGKILVSAYRTQDNEYIYITDKFEGNVFQKAIASQYPLKNEDKMFLANEYKDAVKYKDAKKWQDVVITVAPYMAIVIILVVFLMFFDNAVAPMKEIGNSLASASENMAVALDKVDQVCDIVDVNGNVTSLEVKESEIPD